MKRVTNNAILPRSSNKKYPIWKLNRDKEDNIVKIHLEEYKTLRDELLKKVEFEDKLLNYTILIPSAFITVVNLNWIAGDHKILILLSPIIFYALGLVYAFHDYTIVNIARYINENLRPDLTLLLHNQKILGYENYLFSERTKFQKSFVGRLYTVAKTFLVVLGPVIIIMYFLSNWRWNLLKFDEKVLLVFDLVMIPIAVYVRIQVWDNNWKTIANKNGGG